LNINFEDLIIHPFFGMINDHLLNAPFLPDCQQRATKLPVSPFIMGETGNLVASCWQFGKNRDRAYLL
jgi:hypothetical protein